LDVLLKNIGAALILFLIRIVISIGLTAVMFFPGILLSLCCFLRPVLLLVQGAVPSLFSTLWTGG